MRYKRADFDSLNLSDKNFISLLADNKDYIIVPVKGISDFEPQIWFKEFGKSLNRCIIEASVIFTNLGIALPLKTYSRSQNMQVLEFAGLHGLDERSEFLKKQLLELWSQLKKTKITRIDICIDWSKIPRKVIKELEKDRRVFKWVNSTYFKTEKEKKKNYYINIIAYDKALESNLDYPLVRLEFSFGRSFFDGMYLEDLPKAIKKMEKTIKRKAGVTVKINPLFSHA